jgi:hypothetical protein
MRLGLVVVMLSSTLALASPAAEKLFQDGKQFLQAGKLPEACDAFRKSQELEPRIGTLLNLGKCEEKRDRVATAWEAFVAARALAKQNGDKASLKKGAEADTRIAAITPKLPYLTIRTTPLAGLVVTRDGTPVSAAELDHEVLIDPGRYELEATAPGHATWKRTAVVAIGQKVVIEIPPLASDATANAPATTATPPPVVATARPAVPVGEIVASPEKPRRTGRHKLGLGVGAGFSSDNDFIYGGRAVVEIAAVGPGAVRVVPSVFYTNFLDPTDQNHNFDLYALGLGLEYIAPIAPWFSVAGGAGVGIDLIKDNYDNPGTEQAWGAIRLSPTVRVGDSVDIGVHVQLVKTADNSVGLAELGVDYFFY